jgi:predicted transcriptional regulator
LRRICRELALAMGDVQYHVQKLERAGEIRSRRRGLYRFFYPSSLFGENQESLLGILSLSTPREVILSLIERPWSSQDELASSLRLSQPTVSWHLKRLVGLGVLERRQTGRRVTYRISPTEEADIASFVRSYHHTTWERWSDRLAGIFMSYDGEEQ